MTLSTLRIPKNEQETEFMYGLWNGKRFLHVGTQKECNDLKDSLEREEQLTANAVWAQGVYEDRLNYLLKAGMPERNARNVVDTMFRKFASL
jgi:hypothetical protein